MSGMQNFDCDTEIRPWPIRLSLIDGESLYSWLARVAWAHGLNPYYFVRMIHEKISLTDYYEKEMPDHIIKQLAYSSGEDYLRLRKSAPSGIGWYPVSLFQFKNKKGGVRRKKAGATPVCPLCLYEDKTPHIRLEWRDAFVTCCNKHNILLVDHCEACGGVINFFTQSKVIVKDRYFAYCPTCGNNLLETNFTTPIVAIHSESSSEDFHMKIGRWDLTYKEYRQILFSVINLVTNMVVAEHFVKNTKEICKNLINTKMLLSTAYGLEKMYQLPVIERYQLFLLTNFILLSPNSREFFCTLPHPRMSPYFLRHKRMETKKGNVLPSLTSCFCDGVALWKSKKNKEETVEIQNVC